MRGRCNGPAPRGNVGWGFLSSRKIDFPSSPSFRWGVARTARRSTYGMFLHPCLDCKQVGRKSGPENSQIAPFTCCSTQDIRGERRLSLVEPTGALASQWAAKQSRRLFSRRSSRVVSSVAAVFCRRSPGQAAGSVLGVRLAARPPVSRSGRALGTGAETKIVADPLMDCRSHGPFIPQAQVLPDSADKVSG